MFSHIVLQLTIYLLSGGVGVGCALLLAASWHDMKDIARRRGLAVAAQKLHQPKQPSIALLIYTHNNATTLTECLRAVNRSNYHNYTVTVIDNVSIDGSKNVAIEYRQKHPNATVRLYNKRQLAPLFQALHQGYRSGRAHDLVLVLRATDSIAPTLLKQCAAQFVVQPNLGSLQLYRHHTQSYTVTSLLPRLIELSWHVAQKALPAQLRRRPQIGTSGVMYRHSEFTQRTNSPSHQSRYAATLQVDDMSESVLPLPARRPRTSALVWLGAAIGVALMSYLVIVATLLISSTYLLLSWIAVSLWTLSCIWTDTTMPLPEKLQLSFAAPLTYVVLFVHLLLLVVTIPARSVTHRQRRHRLGNWLTRQLTEELYAKPAFSE